MSDAAMDIGLPEKMTCSEDASHVEVIRRWFGLKFVILTVFAVFWDGFLVVWYAKALGGDSLMAVLFPLIHVAIGTALTYYVVAGWLNRTQVYVDRQGLYVRHRPLPWWGKADIDAADLKQLYVKEVVSRNRKSGETTFELRAITHAGRNIKIVGGLETQEQGLFLEQKIEKFLGIENARVPGEVGR
jgi:hypothetical protein